MSDDKQSAGAVFMIRPANFVSNPQTAPSNAFQRQAGEAGVPAEHESALSEFDGLAAALEQAGVRVLVYEDTPAPHTPDAVFPNNWVSTHADGTVVLYPMLAENRRTERRMDIVEDLSLTQGYRVTGTVDLSHHEDHGVFLEGTGSMVLDRVNRVAYACLSPRTGLDALGEFGQRLDYEIVAFDAVDESGDPIYHTNVLMCVADRFAVICTAAIRDSSQRQAVLDRLTATGHEIVDIDYAQLGAFAGNMLALETGGGQPILAKSRRAHRSLSDAQLDTLTRHSRIVSAPIDVIEDSAGGSVRCMLAEIHLPPA